MTRRQTDTYADGQSQAKKEGR